MERVISHKITIDFGPFIRGLEKLQTALSNMGRLQRRKYISTSYAPKLGPGIDI